MRSCSAAFGERQHNSAAGPYKHVKQKATGSNANSLVRAASGSPVEQHQWRIDFDVAWTVGGDAIVDDDGDVNAVLVLGLSERSSPSPSPFTPTTTTVNMGASWWLLVARCVDRCIGCCVRACLVWRIGSGIRNRQRRARRRGEVDVPRRDAAVDRHGDGLLRAVTEHHGNRAVVRRLRDRTRREPAARILVRARRKSAGTGRLDEQETAGRPEVDLEGALAVGPAVRNRKHDRGTCQEHTTRRVRRRTPAVETRLRRDGGPAEWTRLRTILHMASTTIT